MMMAMMMLMVMMVMVRGRRCSHGCVPRIKSKKGLWLVDPTLFFPSPTPPPKVEG